MYLGGKINWPESWRKCDVRFRLEGGESSAKDEISVGLRSEEHYGAITEILSIGVHRAQGSCLSNQQMYSFNV